MQFKDVVGHTELKRRLIQAVKDRRISHAQLFVGKEGVGALPLALAYAQYLSCQNPKDDDSCGDCPTCHKFASLVHPDLHFVLPVGSKKSKPITNWFIRDWRKAFSQNPYITEQQWYDIIDMENKQGVISVAEAESIIAKLNYKAYEGKFKVMIVWLPERMNAQAANKLLKLIEEPPQQTVFLLVSVNKGGLLKTILSRTQQISVPPIDKNSIAEALEKRHSISNSVAKSVASLSEGSYIDAIHLAQNSNEKQKYFEQFVYLMHQSYASSPDNVLNLLHWAEDMASFNREKQKRFLLYAERMIREIFILNQKVEKVVYLGGEEATFSAKFSPFINSKNVARLYEEFNLAYLHISYNGNAKMVFTDLALKLMKLISPSVV
ncbi:MAG: DNA polymerase III subunit delta' [Prevotellaceae bacterium]|jgi:DNA polymerase-3 subunit delta'|nr:DNA polymerase III subunit delta' [Prevotellaceae bacterium]